MADAMVTLIARKKLVRARAGAIELPPIVAMAFGTGGVDADGAFPHEAEAVDDADGIRNVMVFTRDGLADLTREVDGKGVLTVEGSAVFAAPVYPVFNAFGFAEGAVGGEFGIFEADVDVSAVEFVGEFGLE